LSKFRFFPKYKVKQQVVLHKSLFFFYLVDYLLKLKFRVHLFYCPNNFFNQISSNVEIEHGPRHAISSEGVNKLKLFRKKCRPPWLGGEKKIGF